MKDLDLSILVISCDKYSDWWGIFFRRFETYWNNCKFPIFLLSNHLHYSSSKVNTIKVGDDIDWSTNLIFGLDRIKSEYVLLLLDDAPLNDFVINTQLHEIINFVLTNKVNYLNLKASPTPPRVITKNFGVYPSGLLYRAALVPCIWNRSVLKSLLIPGETAWEFEVNGSVRSDSYDSFYSVRHPFINFLHCVIKGEICRKAYSELVNSGEIGYVKNFKKMGLKSYLKTKYVDIRSSLLSLFYYKHRRFIRDLFQ